MEQNFISTENSIAKAISIVQSNKTTASEKTRSLFYLRCLDTEEAALALEACITRTSVLIDHEVAYILGQMKQKASIPFLLKLMADTTVDDIVRHEAIEALGNFEDISLIENIQPHLQDKNPIIYESAILSIKKLQETDRLLKAGQDSTKDNLLISKYQSRDPAFPFEGSFEEALAALKSGNITEKYRAIFYFRDLNTKEAVDALASEFQADSDLLKHEIAYVFGQMQNPYSVDALIKVLEDTNQAAIVRHEAAEALGNIGTEEARLCLSNFLNSDIKIIRESASVGLGILNNDDNEYSNIDSLSNI